MKQVYVLRHAPKYETGQLTEEGKEFAKQLQNALPKFDLLIASDSPRTQETVILLTDIAPTIDPRAGFYHAPQEISDEMNKQAKDNPDGFTGVYLANDTIREKVTDKAQELVDLILETLEKLQPDEKALIISHDITMIPAERLLTKDLDVKSFAYLSGFIVDENKEVTLYSPEH